MWVSIGGVRVKGLMQLPRFFRLAFAARKAALAGGGCSGVDMFRRGRLFFVVSIWGNPAQIKTYAHSGVHGRLMQNESDLFYFFHNMTVWRDDMPTRDEAVAIWREKHGDFIGS